jgi:L-threonylcarbamoyladenylate synthase
MTVVVEPTAEAIQRAAELLRAGELVGMPTETVYGLGADARNAAALAKIFAAKNRPADHPLIVHLPDAEQLPRWAAAIPDEALALARAFWPGPLTLVLKRADAVPDEVTGGQDTVGLRIPNHPVALALLHAFGAGIAAPSANRFGRISPTTAAHVRDELGDKVAMILDGGPCDIGIESTILDLSRGTPVILRPGAISADAIAAVIGRRPQRRGESGASESELDSRSRLFESGDVSPATPAPPRVSGSLAAHYAPATPLQLVPAEHLAARATQLAATGRPVAVLSRECHNPHDPRLIWLAAPPDATGFAHDLYANLRRLDTSGADCILIETPPDAGEWHAVADRLGRAAAGSGAGDEP